MTTPIVWTMVMFLYDENFLWNYYVLYACFKLGLGIKQISRRVGLWAQM